MLREAIFSTYLFKLDEPYPEPYLPTRILWCCVHTHTCTRFRVRLFVLAKIFYIFAREKNAGPLFEIDRKLVPYRLERRHRRHHHTAVIVVVVVEKPPPPAVSASLRVTKIPIITIILLFRNTLKDAATRAIRRTIGRRGRSKKKKNIERFIIILSINVCIYSYIYIYDL